MSLTKQFILPAVFLCLATPVTIAITDFNNNGASDVWEIVYSAEALVATAEARAADQDNDGYSNLVEAGAGTDPYDVHSRPQVKIMGIEEANVSMTYSAEIGMNYQLFSKATLGEDAAWLGIGTPELASTKVISKVLVAQGGGKYFYRVENSDEDSDTDGITNWEEENLVGFDPFSANSFPGELSDSELIEDHLKKLKEMEEDKELIVYSTVPNLAPSEFYSLSVRPEVGSGDAVGPWREAFAFITRCKEGIKDENKYFERLTDWSNTYINFEMAKPVEIEITRLDGLPIQKAAAHPAAKVKSCEVRDGKAYVVLTSPCQIAVDIDGQMDDQNTGKGYDGPAIHTVTVFANPVLENRPSPTDAGVFTVAPGEVPPSDGTWDTLYFLPGVHDIGLAFPVNAERNYYIPGDAIVYGTLHNDEFQNGHDIHVFGYGTLSGARLTHPDHVVPHPESDHPYRPIHINGARNTSVEGITIADSAHHSLMLISGYDPDRPTDIRWVKIFTWRANGDGINPFANGLIEDSFIRTQDDSMYVNGRGIRRVTFWNDYNGSTFVLTAIPNSDLVVEDCDVIYARAGWDRWSGGRLFNMRGLGGGEGGKGVIFRNIRVEDSRPTLQHFMIAMKGIEPYSPIDRTRTAGDLTGVLFQNIEIAAPSVLGEPDVLWGAPDAEIIDITFDNVTIGGNKIESLDHFLHNEYVREITFE